MSRPVKPRITRKNAQLDTDSRYATDVLLEDKIAEPVLYRVLLHNDDYTTMEFVVKILMDVFKKDPEEATMIMLAVHKRGIGMCGMYPLEIAETKVTLVKQKAVEAGFPLRCTIEQS